MPKGAAKKAGATSHKPAKEELVAPAAHAGVGGEEIPPQEEEKPGFGYSDRPPKRAAAKKASEATAASEEKPSPSHTKSTTAKKKHKTLHDESEDVEVEAEEKSPPAKRAKKSSSTSTGTQHQTKSAATSEHALVESGDIYFFYRPKIDKKHCATIQDVQRLYMLMVPTETEESHGHKKASPNRMIVIPKKHLPAIAAHEKLWGLVYKVSNNINEMRDDLLSKTYQTKTRGERHAQPARPAGFGVYRIIRDHKHTTHLCYVRGIF